MPSTPLRIAQPAIIFNALPPPLLQFGRLTGTEITTSGRSGGKKSCRVGEKKLSFLRIGRARDFNAAISSLRVPQTRLL